MFSHSEFLPAAREVFRNLIGIKGCLTLNYSIIIALTNKTEPNQMNGSSKIRLKICGMRYALNVNEVAKIRPDILGFIFYPPSPRYLPPEIAGEITGEVPAGIEKAGVFVNENTDEVIRLSNELKLDYVQLHGAETPEMCAVVKEQGFNVIKVFGIDERFDFNVLDPYKDHVDYFLFDTKSPKHGGTGLSFEWKILDKYDGELPFFLSGGIDLDHLNLIEELTTQNLFALDVNSRFELSPGMKDLNKVRMLVDILRK